APDIALAAARTLAAEPAAGAAEHALYARAMLAAGQPRQALAQIAPFDSNAPMIEAVHIAALLALGERNTLQPLLYRRLTSTDLPRAQRNDLLEALADSAPLTRG